MNDEDKAKLEKRKNRFSEMMRLCDELDMRYDDVENLETLLEIGKEIGLTEEELTPNIRLIEVAKKLEDDSLTNRELNKLKKEVKQIKKSVKKIKRDEDGMLDTKKFW